MSKFGPPALNTSTVIESFGFVSATRGRRQIQKKIDENNSHMERISIEIDRAERREARHHTYTNRKPLADQDASKLERHIRQTSTWKREEAKYRRLSSKLRGELTRSKQHRFVRPPTPTHPAWDVGLPSAQMIQREMEKANANECVLEDRVFSDFLTPIWTEKLRKKCVFFSKKIGVS